MTPRLLRNCLQNKDSNPTTSDFHIEFEADY